MNIKNLTAIVQMVAVITIAVAVLILSPTATAQVMQDTINGWYYWGSQNVTLDTAYTYLNDTDKVQGRSSQGFGSNIITITGHPPPIIWEKISDNCTIRRIL